MSESGREEIDRLKREADLVEYACNRAGFEVDWKESSPRGNPIHWILRRPSDDAKILVLRGRSCWLYFDLRQHGQELGSGRRSPGAHGTIVDFVQQELGLPTGRGLPSFGLAIKEIRDFIGIVRHPDSPRRSGTGDVPEERRDPGREVQQRWSAAKVARSSGWPAGGSRKPRCRTSGSEMPGG